MEQLTRRSFVEKVLGGALTLSLVRTLYASGSLGAAVRPVAAKWLLEVEEVSRGLKGAKLRPSEWQTQIEGLFHRLDLADLLRSIDYASLTKVAVFPEDRESVHELEFPAVEGLPASLSYIPMLVAFKTGRAVVPHGHRNMVSMHMLIDGEVHARHYERRGGDKDALVVEPTLDKHFARGELSTVSDERNNVHWFKAVKGPVFMFNVGVFGIDGTKDFTGRDYIDPLGAQRLGDGTLRARRLDHKEAFRLYGNT